MRFFGDDDSGAILKDIRKDFAGTTVLRKVFDRFHSPQISASFACIFFSNRAINSRFASAIEKVLDSWHAIVYGRRGVEF